jgi:hypothetical protein
MGELQLMDSSYNVKSLNKGNSRFQFLLKKSNFIFLVLFLIILAFDFINIKYKLVKMDFIFVHINNSKVIAQTAIGFMASINSILFAVYFVLIQISRNKYPLDFIELYFKDNLRFLLFHISINIFSSLILIVVYWELDFTKLFYITHAIFCLISFVTIFGKSKIFDSLDYVQKCKVEIFDRLDRNVLDVKEIENYLDTLYKYSEQSLSNNEIYFTKGINSIYQEIMIHFMKVRTNLLLCNEKEYVGKITEIENKIISAILNQIKLGLNYNNNSYVDESLSNIRTLLEKCVECDAIETFRNYCTRIDRFFNYNVFRKQVNTSGDIIRIYGDIAEYILDNKDRKEWIDIIKDRFQYYCITSYIHSDETILKVFFREYFALLQCCLEKGKFDLYNELFNNLLVALDGSLGHSNCNSANFIQILLVVHASEVVKINNITLLNNFISIVQEIGKIAIRKHSKELCSFVDTAYNIIEKEKDNVDLLNKLRTSRQLLSSNAVNYNKEMFIILLPEYSKILEKEKGNIDAIRKVLEDCKELMYRCLLKKEESSIIFLLNHINQSMLLHGKNEKLAQKEYIEIYEDLLNFCIQTDASENFHILMDEFSSLIKSMDKEDLISHDLFSDIMKLYREVSALCIKNNKDKLCISINQYVYEFSKNLNIVHSKKDNYNLILNNLFQAGVDGVENDSKDIIRNVSNHLGWLSMNAIDNNDNDTVKRVIDKAGKLYNLCIDFNIDERTAIFIGTLFVIIGGRTTSQNNHPCTQIIITQVLKMKRLELLQKSQAVREYESENWDKHLNNDAKGNIEKFMKQLNIIRDRSLKVK